MATPQRRMKTIERLAAAGLEVTLMVAPLIPGITEDDLGDLLQAAKDAGARHAGYVFLRLPGPVAVVFGERLRAALPLRAEKVLSRVRQARGGQLYDSRFGVRGRGEGPLAAAAGVLFDQTCRKLGLHHRERERTMGEPSWPTTFRRPPRAGEQLRLL